MYRTRFALPCLMAAGLLACQDAPTPSAPDIAPALASMANPHFLDVSAANPNSLGYLPIIYKLTGLGSTGATTTMGSANATTLWGCQTTIAGEFDVIPAPQSVSAPVSAASLASSARGNVQGNVFVASPPATLQCLNVHKTLVPLSASFTNVMLSHPDAGTLSIPGTFASTFYTLPQGEVLPSLTAINLPDPNVTFLVPQGYTVDVHNPGNTLPLVAIQGWLRQGANYRAAGGTLVHGCTPTGGELPPGDCNVSFDIIASNALTTVGGGADLVPGTATFEVQLWVGTGQRTVSILTTTVTLQ
jgi:hypothetical protein